MNKKTLTWVIIIIVVAAISFFVIQDESGDNVQPDDSNDTNQEVRLIEPEEGSVVSSPLTVKGEARGSWFFEANIPIEIQDDEGNVLARAGAQSTTGEWMTTDFVEFEGELEFNPGNSENGYIVVKKDNPSGLPENDDSRKFPIRFSETNSNETTTFNVYFQSREMGDNADCSSAVAVTRTVPKTLAVGEAAINSLLEGPTDEESPRLISSVPENVILNSLSVEDGVAYADFSEELDENIGGSCMVTAIRAQIEKTLLQFSTVDDVVISINGQTEGTLQP